MYKHFFCHPTSINDEVTYKLLRTLFQGVYVSLTG
jgi:hypothetical protein